MITNFFDRVTRLSLHFRWITVVLSLVIMAVGVWAMTQLNLELTPRIEFPQTVVVAQWPDAASADDFLQQVTMSVEEALRPIPGVVNVESTTSQGFAFVIVRNDFGLDQDQMVTDVETAVATLSLPDAVDIQVLNFSLSDLPVVVASVSSGELSLSELKELVQTDLQPRLENLEQISRVNTGGGQELPDETIAQAPAPTPTPVPLPTVAPGRLPLVVAQGAKSFGLDIEFAQEVTPELLAGLEGTEEQILQVLTLIPADVVPYAPVETLVLLPREYIETLPAETMAQLNELTADFGGVGQYNVTQAYAILHGADPDEVLAAAVTPTPEPTTPVTTAVTVTATLPQVTAVPLPDTWIMGAAALGQTITDTSDITLPLMQGILQFAPEQLAELTPEMWRALDPTVTAVALPVISHTLSTTLTLELQAIQLAAAGIPPAPVPLPPSWVAAAASMGQTISTTADIPPQLFGMAAAAAPELLADLTPELLLAFPPAALANLPADFVATLDPGLQQTLTNMAVAQAHYLAAQTPATADQTAETVPTPAPDPARLPDMLIQGAQAAGLTIELAGDITPDMIRLFGGLGAQGVQALQLLTPDNLRLLQPEVIALLPADFVAVLDSELRAELDVLAADFGGAGALAVAEAAAAAALSADAPPLSGVWTEPGPNGEAPMFKTAADLLHSPFAPTAAALLNSIPTQAERPIELMADLAPEVMGYLAQNETDFVANLDPTALEMLSPETLGFLLETYPEAFAADLAARLQGIAAGTVQAFVPEATITRTDGDPAVIINLYKDGDANTVEVAHRVFDLLEAYKVEHPEIQTNLVFEQATFIEDSIAGVSREGALGAGFAVVVILLFLSGQVGGRYRLSWRATLVTAVSIPLSIFAAFVLMRLVPPIGSWLQAQTPTGGGGLLTFFSRLFPTSITLNIMTLSGLTVAIGRVVDDSIVVLENSYRYIQQGYDPKEAVLTGTKEVAIAIFSATATTVAVFLPLGLIGGIIGSFFLPFGLTVTYALAASFIVSITVVPALTYLVIRREYIPEERETALQRWYTPVLVWSLGNRFVTMLLATLIFLGSLALLGQLPRSFIPSLGEPTINVTVSLPAGTGMVETNEQVARLETAVADLPGIETVQVEIGSAGGITAFFGGGGIAQNAANIAISVADLDNLTTVTQQVRQQAEEVFGAEQVVVSAESLATLGGFALTITGDSPQVLQDVAEDVKTALAAIDEDGDGTPDIVNVTSSVDNAGANGAETIVRIDGRPAISFAADLETENTLGVTNAAKAAVAALPNLPAGVTVSEGFESQQQVEGFQSMVKAIGYSILIVYLIMALTFRSLIHPFTILFSLPFALVGAALALYLTNSVLGISAMIGLMMLVGIVVTNGIVLMELVQQLRHRGQNAYEALVQGGRTRLRPIWMTALTAILALIPLAASQEAGAIIASELARAVMGGLLVSTALTLLVIPVVYSLLDDVVRRLARK